MPRDLFVRSFDSELYGELKTITESEGITLASVTEEAFRAWIEHRKKTRSKHILILYENQGSFEAFVKSLEALLSEKWFKTFLGPESFFPFRLLKERGWYDSTIRPYRLFEKKPLQYCKQSWKALAEKGARKKICAIGNLPDMSKVITASGMPAYIKRAFQIEDLYNSEHTVPGLLYCPYHMREVTDQGLLNIIGLIQKHDLTFLSIGRDFYRIRLTEENSYKLLG